MQLRFTFHLFIVIILYIFLCATIFVINNLNRDIDWLLFVAVDNTAAAEVVRRYLYQYFITRQYTNIILTQPS